MIATMKRCPQCRFIYLDSDETCDLDGSKLVGVADAELNSGNQSRTTEASRSVRTESFFRSGRRSLLLASGAALTIALALFVVYNGSRTREQNTSSVGDEVNQSAKLATTPYPNSPTPTPLPEATPSVEVTAANPTQVADSPKKSTHGVVSSNPVSTTPDQRAKSGKVIIHLSNGAGIEADEAWRTREGIWYRRNGLVTLLKSNVVRSIERKH